jgi:hypothetical protein
VIILHIWYLFICPIFIQICGWEAVATTSFRVDSVGHRNSRNSESAKRKLSFKTEPEYQRRVFDSPDRRNAHADLDQTQGKTE